MFRCPYLYSQNTGIYKYEFNDNCKNIYGLIYGLRIEDARKKISAEKNNNPDNLFINYLEGNCAFINGFLSDNINDYNKNKKLLISNLKFLESKKSNSKYKYFCIAELYLQIAILSAKYKDNFANARYGKNAYDFYIKSVSNYPDFIPAKAGLGYIYCLLGNIPENLHWIVNLFGFNTDSKKGIKLLDEAYNYSVSSDSTWRKKNSLLIFSIFKVFKNNGYDESFFYNKYISWLEQKDDLLSAVITADILNKIGRTDKAINVLSRFDLNRQYHSNIYNLLLGTYKLERLDKDANIYFNRFLSQEVFFNKADAMRKLAWFYLINGNKNEYMALMKSVAKFDNIVTSADKNAVYEASKGIVPDKMLLKVRLLYDGGYYKRAKDSLSKIKVNLIAPNNLAEYHYRFGQVYEKTNDLKAAKQYYAKSIELKNTNQRYSASSALNLGHIYKKENDLKMAGYYFKMILDMQFSEYYDEIISDAKQSLKSL